MTDAIITWVNGNDPAHKSKRRLYIGDKSEDQFDDMGSDTRYSSNGEIFLCVASILRFAPFFRKIFIVTDNQNPNISWFVDKYFPTATTKIEIVDHKVIFQGYEQYLPVFNSRSIETMLFRIPGLAEQFVYFNDDVFLFSNIKEDEWFKDGKSIIYAHKFNSSSARILRWLSYLIHGRRIAGYKDAMLNAADIVGSNYFWYMQHMPWAMKKSWFEQFYKSRNDLIERNIKYRFRDFHQFNPQALYGIQAYKDGIVSVRHDKNISLFIKMERKDRPELFNKIKRATSMRDLKFGCISSLDKASKDDISTFYKWVGEIIGVEFSYCNKQSRL